MNYRTFRNRIVAMPRGKRFRVITIDLSLNCIETLREMIKCKVVMPVREEVVKSCKDVESVMNGTIIIPEMDYIRL